MPSRSLTNTNAAQNKARTHQYQYSVRVWCELSNDAFELCVVVRNASCMSEELRYMCCAYRAALLTQLAFYSGSTISIDQDLPKLCSHVIVSDASIDSFWCVKSMALTCFSATKDNGNERKHDFYFIVMDFIELSALLWKKSYTIVHHSNWIRLIDRVIPTKTTSEMEEKEKKNELMKLISLN